MVGAGKPGRRSAGRFGCGCLKMFVEKRKSVRSVHVRPSLLAVIELTAADNFWLDSPCGAGQTRGRHVTLRQRPSFIRGGRDAARLSTAMIRRMMTRWLMHEPMRRTGRSVAKPTMRKSALALLELAAETYQ